MWVAVVNNLPEIALGLCWSGVVGFVGYKFGAWRAKRR